MRRCELCSQLVPCKVRIDGKVRNLQNRRYCLTCSPYRAHNTRPLTEPLTEQSRQERTAEVRRQKYRKYQRKMRRQRKRMLVTLLGGCCRICGYSRDCPAAYAFHHRDPASKAFDLGRRGLLRRWEVLLAKVRKCVLLCCRCHAEVHDGLHKNRELQWREGLFFQAGEGI